MLKKKFFKCPYEIEINVAPSVPMEPIIFFGSSIEIRYFRKLDKLTVCKRVLPIQLNLGLFLTIWSVPK